uniref:Methyltransferase type 11 domain-containing protein n=1 Tax=Ciona savignyi TaxID=51511 RepID=H2Z5E6_CIOSA
MNAEAQKKSLYRNLTIHFISSENRIPVDDASYDVIISIGGFSPSHIQADCIKDVVRLLKPGGIFWFSIRKSSGAEKYNKAVDEAIAELVSQKLCQSLILEEFDYYTYDSDEK